MTVLPNDPNEVKKNGNSEPSATTSKLLIYFPKKLWLGNISKQFPYADIQINAFVPIQTDPFIGNSMISIRSREIDNILSTLEKESSLISYSVMEKSQDSIVISTRTRDNLLLRAIVKNFILINLPVKVFDGKAEFIINGSRRHIDNFIEMLSVKGIKTEIMRLTQYSKNSKNVWLTTKQNIVYQEARKRGYYDHPRKITLTKLAGELGMAKSSLSTMMQRIHNILLGN